MLEVGNAADAPNPPFKEILESSFDLGWYEPTTSGLDLPMLYWLTYEANTGANRGNLGSESR